MIITGKGTLVVCLAGIAFLFCPAILSMPSGMAYAAHSTITEGEGYACMGDDKSRKETEKQAMAEAKRHAVEKVLTYLKSETKVKDFQLEKDIINAYANASIKVVSELEKGWYKDTAAGDCYRIKIKAEVTPDEKAMIKIAKEKDMSDDPAAPLHVKIWTDKQSYRQGEKVKIFLKGNKPFYARVLYRDVSGNMIQLLPNPFRGDNYFHGGAIYELPSGNDRFDLEVGPPFGREDIIVYASTSQVGDIDLEAQGGVFKVKTKTRDVGMQTRGVKVQKKGTGPGVEAAELIEEKSSLHTTR